MKTKSFFVRLIMVLLVVALPRVPAFAQVDKVKLTFKGSWPGHSRGSAIQVTVTNNLAYVSLNFAGLAIFDVSQPANPVRLGGLNLNAPTRAIHVAGNYAYVAAWNGGGPRGGGSETR